MFERIKDYFGLHWTLPITVHAECILYRAGFSLVVLFVLSLIFLPVLSSGCSKKQPPIEKTTEFEEFPKDPSYSCAGVVVYGEFNFRSKGWIENTNDFPVRIVYTIASDTTYWSFVFQPGHVRKLRVIKDYVHIQIYDMEGRHLGLLVPEKDEE